MRWIIARTIGWLVALTTITSHGQMVNPEQLLSRDSLLIVDIPNVQSFATNAKSNWYDHWFSESIDDGFLRCLDFPAAQYVLSRRSPEEHWFSNTISSFRLDQNEVVKELIALTDSFQPNLSDEEAQFDERRAFELMASIFPGSALWAVEPRGNALEFVFAFEFDPNLFDWEMELVKASASEANRTQVEPVVRVGEIEIYSLPNEEIHFFAYRNTIYGTSSINEDRCKSIASVVLNPDSNKKPLSSSRFLQRVKSKLNWTKDPNSLLFFVRTRDVVQSHIPRPIDALTKERKGPLEPTQSYSAFADMGWGEYCGGVVSVGAKHLVDYHIVFPLALPLADELNTYCELNEQGLNRSQSYFVPSSGATFLQGVSGNDQSSWNRLPTMISPHVLFFITEQQPMVEKATDDDGVASDRFPDLDPIRARTKLHQTGNGTCWTTRFLFTDHWMENREWADMNSLQNSDDSVRIIPEEIFTDIGRGEHLIAMAYSDQAAEYPELFDSFRPLFGFIGRCDSNSYFGVGSGLVKGDFAVSFERDTMAISKDKPSITNLAGVVTSNFLEPQGFVQSWNPIEIPNADVSHIVLISKLDNSIICRGTLDSANRLGDQD